MELFFHQFVLQDLCDKVSINFIRCWVVSKPDTWRRTHPRGVGGTEARGSRCLAPHWWLEATRETTMPAFLQFSFLKMELSAPGQLYYLELWMMHKTVSGWDYCSENFQGAVKVLKYLTKVKVQKKSASCKISIYLYVTDNRGANALFATLTGEKYRWTFAGRLPWAKYTVWGALFVFCFFNPYEGWEVGSVLFPFCRYRHGHRKAYLAFPRARAQRAAGIGANSESSAV